MRQVLGQGCMMHDYLLPATGWGPEQFHPNGVWNRSISLFFRIIQRKTALRFWLEMLERGRDAQGQKTGLHPAQMRQKPQCAHCREMMRESERNLSRIATGLREKLTVFTSGAGTNLRVLAKADFPPSYGKSYNFCAIKQIFRSGTARPPDGSRANFYLARLA
ncbi:hypothetical protein [Brucella intermedia]|uniref:hypothetical protein n=1 Tax=Brucella intermedia TaxID=94625 RepID=UPI001590F835|nr:hypothetical protein [Brucella intermedia]